MHKANFLIIISLYFKDYWIFFQPLPKKDSKLFAETTLLEHIMQLCKLMLSWLWINYQKCISKSCHDILHILILIKTKNVWVNKVLLFFVKSLSKFHIFLFIFIWPTIILFSIKIWKPTRFFFWIISLLFSEINLSILIVKTENN